MQTVPNAREDAEDVATARPRDWIALGILTLACLLYSMDLTVLNLAIPAMSRDLRPTGTQLLWIVDIYGFVLAGTLITMGHLGDRLGRRRLLLLGAAAFGAISILAALSRTAATLIVMRASLGIAGATIAPATLSLIRNIFQQERARAIAIGVWCATYAAGAAVGPIVGGVLLEYFWWGSVFLISIPAMAVLLILGPHVLPEFRADRKGPLDVASAVLSLSAVLSALYGVKRIAEYGFAWSSVLCSCLGLAIGWLFVRRQSHVQSPMINVALFRNATFSTATVVYALASFASIGSLFFVAQFLQSILGLSPIEAGLWSLPFGISCVIGATATPFLTRIVQSEPLMICALVLAVAGFAIFGSVDETTAPATLAAISCSYALGLSCVFTLATDLIVASSPSNTIGAATAVAETGSEFGAALGIAVLGCVGMLVFKNTLLTLAPTSGKTAPSTIGAAVEEAARLGGPSGAELLTISRTAFVESFHAATRVASLSLLIATALMIFQSRSRTRIL